MFVQERVRQKTAVIENETLIILYTSLTPY
jgi:hypothetical protein